MITMLLRAIRNGGVGRPGRAIRLWMLVAVLLFAAGSLPAWGSVIAHSSVPDLTRLADDVVHGKVVAVDGQTDRVSGRSYRLSTVVVDEYLKGSGPARLTVRQLGSIVDGKHYGVIGDAELRVGEEVVLFLRRSETKSDGDALRFMVALGASKFDVRVDASLGQKVAWRSMAGLGVARRGADGRTTVDSPGQGSPGRLSDLLAQIRRLAAGR